jgi:hypothetical protein
VYEVPPVSPLTTIGLLEPFAVIEPGLDVTVNDVAVSPCGVKETVKEPTVPACQLHLPQGVGELNKTPT